MFLDKLSYKNKSVVKEFRTNFQQGCVLQREEVKHVKVIHTDEVMDGRSTCDQKSSLEPKLG